MLRDVVSSDRTRNDFDINERGLHMKTTLLALVLLLAATVVWAASPDRYLHVRVSNPTTHELVRVNVPLSLAEKVIPAINHGQLRDGKVQIGNFRADNVNIHAI